MIISLGYRLPPQDWSGLETALYALNIKRAGSKIAQHRTEPQPLEDRNHDDRRRQQYQDVCEVMGLCHLIRVSVVKCE